MRQLALALVLVFTGCATDATRLPNGCLVNSISYKDSLTAHAKFGSVRWSKILMVDFGAKVGHAGCVFEYAGRIMIYDDTFGSATLTRGPAH